MVPSLTCSRSQNLHFFLPVMRYIQKLVAPLSMCSALDVLAAPMNRLGRVVRSDNIFSLDNVRHVSGWLMNQSTRMYGVCLGSARQMMVFNSTDWTVRRVLDNARQLTAHRVDCNSSSDGVRCGR